MYKVHILSIINLCYSSPKLPHVPHRTEVEKIFPEKACRTTINWISASDTFPLFVQLLSLPAYSYSILLGLIGSVGGLTEGLVSFSCMLVTHICTCVCW